MTLLLEYSNTLLDLHEDIIAVQITRLAWDAFSEITVSSCLLSESQNEPDFSE